MASWFRSTALAAVCLALVACSGEYTGPTEGRAAIAVQSGDAQFGAPNATVLEPLAVVVTDPVTAEPLDNATVTWRVTAGTGAEVTPSESTTNANGVATATLRLGAALGDYQVEARTNGLIGSPARFTARAVQAPAITSAPASANGGDTITITGENFSATPGDNIVLFGGFRGLVTSASTTQLRVVVPQCLPQRTLPLTVAFGAVAGVSVDIDITGSSATPLTLEPGEVFTTSNTAELACLQLPGVGTHQYVVIAQNASTTVGSVATMQLTGLYAGDVVTSVARTLIHRPAVDAQIEFETQLRLRDQELLKQEAQAALRPEMQLSRVAACPTPPQIGDRCSFQVVNNQNAFESVTAELKVISDHALIYQDLNAPAGGLSLADFQALATTFDDPIYETVTAAFGTPSDIDGNGRIIILLTPVVNAMTARGATGIIAGFFYGCDLVSRSVCNGTNSAEIFYTLTADPTGQFSDPRTPSGVMNALLPVLAHEFQHMIAFGYRNNTDVLWLSEGMAHQAEDEVAEAFAQAGDPTNAQRFRIQNYTRASRYLRDPTGTSLLAEGGTGTLELRGAGWLFVKYLVGQYGNTILQQLTQSAQSGVTNVVQRTGQNWNTLLGNWAVALFADDAPELPGAAVAPEHTFPNINLRTSITDGLGYTLRPPVQGYDDFSLSESIPASTQTYLRLQANGATQPQSLTLTGQYGGAFATNAVPQLSILRLQ